MMQGTPGILERGRRTPIIARQLRKMGGETLLKIPRDPKLSDPESAQWYRLVWESITAENASVTWMPQISIGYGIDTGNVDLTVDAICGSLTILIREDVIVKAVAPLDAPRPTDGAEGSQPTEISVVSTPITSWHAAEATYTRFFTVPAKAGPDPGLGKIVARAAGSLSVRVTSVHVGSARQLVLEESATSAFAPGDIVAQSDVMAGTEIELQGRTRFLRVANYGSDPDTCSVIFLLSAL